MPTYRIYYARTPTFHASGQFGTPLLTTADVNDLDRYVYLRTVEAGSLDGAYREMQAEVWSPRGEARELLESLGLGHTSMSTGDVAQDESGVFWECLDGFGWRPIGVRSHEVQAPADADDDVIGRMPAHLRDVVVQSRAKALLPLEVQRWLGLVGQEGYVAHVRRDSSGYAVTFAEREPLPYQQLAWDIHQAVPETGLQSLSLLLWSLDRAQQTGGSAQVNDPAELFDVLWSLVYQTLPPTPRQAQSLALRVHPLDSRALCPECGTALYCALETYASGVPLYWAGDEEQGAYGGFDADPDDGSHTESELVSVYCSACEWRVDLKDTDTTLTGE